MFQVAKSRLWVEDWVLWTDSWAAQANQRIPLMKHKRDNPACQTPSCLPQASTKRTGHDLAPPPPPLRHSADPDTTSRITLDGAHHTDTDTHTTAAPSTRAKPTSGTPATAPAPTAPPDCVVAGAPWMNPPIFCVCGSGRTATYPTIAPFKSNCAYTVLPSSTIHPITTRVVSIAVW